SNTINNFMCQISSLQAELKALSKAQSDTSHIVLQREDELSKSRREYSDLKQKYQESCHREKDLEKRWRETEDKLLEASNESVQISSNLQEAHDWFKVKFESLQADLKSSKDSQSELERVNAEKDHMLQEEKFKAEQMAKRAQEMIRKSRETISKLADFAESSQEEMNVTKQNFKKQLQAERDHSCFTEKKYAQLMESSARQMQALTQELDFIRKHSRFNDE
ncbi:unnamed protein product, partial [Owenia fusiformis]